MTPSFPKIPAEHPRGTSNAVASIFGVMNGAAVESLSTSNLGTAHVHVRASEHASADRQRHGRRRASLAGGRTGTHERKRELAAAGSPAG